MGSIVELLQFIAAGLSIAGTTASFLGTIVDFFQQRVPNRRADELKKLLEDVGSNTEQGVRHIVEGFEFPRPLQHSEKEELIALLVNLTRGARFLTTQGIPRSSYLRCERLLEHLLTSLKPVRLCGEPVAHGLPDWRLERFLGMGAFGEVWLARNPGFPEPRAFKFFTQEEGQEWLVREQKLLFQVKRILGEHPRIVNFLDVAVKAKPYPYLSLEYVDGGSLEDWILEHHADRPPIDKQEVMEGIVCGLAQAHAQHIYHRDLKPANILLTEAPDVQPKIADFGLGKVESNRRSASAGASNGALVGTEMYLPPEAMRPFTQRQPAQDDVFALGVIWYQLATERIERPPYDFSEQLHEVGLDTRTIRLIARCLAQPERRFQDACALEESMLQAPPPESWDPPAGCFDVSYLAREYFGSLAR